MFRRIAIIGGGAAAATLLGEFIDRHVEGRLCLDWYAGTAPHGRGVAYGTPSERHLLNVRAASMGMFGGKPQGFLDYARQQLPGAAGTDFLPRRMYGDYLQSEVEQSLARARSRGIDVHVRPAAEALVPQNDGITIAQGADRHRVDAAVLAIGSLPPQPLGGVDPRLLADGRYVVDPWAFLNSPWQGPPPEEVTIIGLGLTAVDVLLELSARWPRTHFTTLSRHGLLPEAHKRNASAPQDDGAELVEALQDAPRLRSWVALLREATAHARDWRAVIDGLRPHLPTLWRDLPDEERARFLRHARWAWERARHRMPPQIAEQISALEAAGRLHRRRGRMQQVRVNGARLRVDLRVVDNGACKSLNCDLLIQTVGLNTDVRYSHQLPLIDQLRKHGHVQAHPLGLGFLAEADGRLCHGEHSRPRLFAIGALLRGSLWESTAMPEIRQQARSLAERLLAR